MAEMQWRLADMAAALPGARLVGDGAQSVARIHTDSRSLQAGDLFLALRGEKFDAHAFLPEAARLGAVAGVAEHGLAAAGLSGWEVADTREALGALAQHWRGRYTLPLIAVTGSNGKTTVTQMIAQILRTAAGEAALATQGNLNNEIGVPQTLLRLRPTHRLAVVELGMNHPGEITRLARWCQPSVALVNNAQREHQEFMASVEAVADENASVFDHLSADGVAVFPHADAFASRWRERAKGRRVMTFDLDVHSQASVRLLQAQWQVDHWQLRMATPQGEAELSLWIAGRHNLANALAATTCALAAGVDLQTIVAGLSAFQAVQGRSRACAMARANGDPWTLIDDTYNANPDSVLAAIDVLASLPAPRALVLGDMGEVGHQGPAFHAEVGAYARRQGIEVLLALGELSAHAVQAFGAGGRHFATWDALQGGLAGALGGAASVLVKGSRFMRMERVVQALQSSAPDSRHGAPHQESQPCS